MTKVLHIDNKEEFEEVAAEWVVLVDFYADWCGPCRMLGPIMEELAEDFDGKAKIIKVNVDNGPELAGAFGVSSIPSVFILNNKEPLQNIVGVNPKDVYAGKLTELVGE